MNLSKHLSEEQRAALAGAAICVLLGLLFLMTHLGDRLTNASYDLPFYFRPDITNVSQDDVLLVVMDDESHRQFGPFWSPWDRSHHARLLERLKACGTKVVAFDILWDLEDKENPAADRQLAQAAKAHGRVAMAAKVKPDISPQGEVIAWKIWAPFPALRSNVVWGAVESSLGDKSVRRHYYYPNTPSLAWKVAEMTMSNPPMPFQPRWMNYYGPPGLLPRLSFWEVMLETNRVGPAQLSNKVVFVGAQYDTGFSGGVGTDDFRTPFTRWTGRKAPGVEVEATTYLNLLRGDWLRRPSPWLGFGVVLLSGLLLGGALSRLRPTRAAALGVLVFAGLALVAVLLLWRFQVWFPWLIIGVVQLPAALAWFTLTHTTRLLREKQRLEQDLALVSSAAAQAAAQSPVAPALGPQSAGLYLPDNARPEPVAGQDAQAPLIPDYALLRCVGRGAYGEVWLARDVIGSYHALKVIHRRHFQNQAEPFDREFRGIQKFTPISRSHPGFVHILHVGRNDAAGYFYYAMEAGDDEQSGQRINPDSYSPNNLSRLLSKGGRLPATECLRLALTLTSALEHLHQHHLIHRDIKPSNIIFVNAQPKLADIGLVTEVGTSPSDVSYVGTQGYIAPEGPGKPPADIYSLGKVIYQASTGLACARFPELPTALVEAPEQQWLLQINRIFLKACEPDLGRRYRTAAQMFNDLQQLETRMQTG